MCVCVHLGCGVCGYGLGVGVGGVGVGSTSVGSVGMGVGLHRTRRRLRRSVGEVWRYLVRLAGRDADACSFVVSVSFVRRRASVRSFAGGR